MFHSSAFSVFRDVSEANTKRIKEVENRPIHTGRAVEEKDGQEEIRQRRKTKALHASRRTTDSDSILPHLLLPLCALFILPPSMTK